jgi:hypothetical protein
MQGPAPHVDKSPAIRSHFEVSNDDEDSEDFPSAEPPPASLTREIFLEWRSPRRGKVQAERMNNALWEWLIPSRWNAWRINQHFEGPGIFEAGPGWCFDRMGRSTTELPDGRKVLIAGEHEDSYDPDFFIYNDVVLLHPGGEIEILGYPPEVFPPTDFHTATLAGQRIVVIGNLGYPKDRKTGITQVAVLDLKTFAFTLVEPADAGPGWLHKHTAELSGDGASILVRGGKIDPGPGDKPLLENIDDWCLHLGEWRWERLTDRRWPRCEVRRKDKKGLHLFEIGQAKWSRDMRWEDAAESLKKVEEALGKPPDFELVDRLYRPDTPHQPIEDREGEYGVKRIQFDGVVVRYVEDSWAIQITVEGTLPEETINAVAEDLRGKLAALENADCEVVKW